MIYFYSKTKVKTISLYVLIAYHLKTITKTYDRET